MNALNGMALLTSSHSRFLVLRGACTSSVENACGQPFSQHMRAIRPQFIASPMTAVALVAIGVGAIFVIRSLQ